MHGKALNRLRQQLADAKIGILPDVGAPHAKGYRFTLGKHGDGTPARFWLGHHRTEAQHRASCYLALWADLAEAGQAHWTDELVAKARELGDQKVALVRRFVADMQQHASDVDRQGREQRHRIALTMPEAAPHVTAVGVVSVSGRSAAAAGTKTLYEAIDAYLASLRGKRRSESHKWRAEQVLRTTLKGIRDDCPLASIDYLWLDGLCDHLKARPLSKKGKPANRKPISPQTVKTTLQYLRQFFVWVDDTGFGGWQGPHKLTKPFRVRLDDLSTPAELRRASTIEQFDVQTLVALYRAANDHQRAVMLTALFTAGTQQELAVLEKSEFDLDAGTVHHFRNKTRVEGRFWLPPELVILLEGEFQKHPGEPLAFYTAQGRPLVTYRNGKLVSDAVRQMWTDLRARAGVPDALPFKHVRKFVADWMTREGGETMGQVALSHARQSILAKNYTSARDFDAFNKLQRGMYAQLTRAGMFEGGQGQQSSGGTAGVLRVRVSDVGGDAELVSSVAAAAP